MAPGPAPRLDRLVTEIGTGPGAEEELCYLTGDWRILQLRRGHRWSLDDLVTAWFAASLALQPPSRFLDLGCGIGSVLMMICWRFPTSRGTGIEAQAISANLARRSLRLNGIEQRCVILDGDLRDLSALPEQRSFDLVTGTPPYLPLGTAAESPRIQRGPCRIEHRGGIEAYCMAAAVALSEHGRFVTCAGGGQRQRVLAAAASAGLIPRASRDVVPREGKPTLFSVYELVRQSTLSEPHGFARTGGVMPRVEVAGSLDPLIVRRADGRWTDEFVTLRRQMGMPA